MPAGNRFARDRVPRTLLRAAVAVGVLAFEHHGKIQPVVGVVGLALQVLHLVGQGHGHRGVGVGAGLPGVARKQRGQLREIGREIQLHRPGVAVPGGGGKFHQHKLAGAAGAAVQVFEVVQTQQRAVGVLEHKDAVGPGGAGGQQVLRVVCIVVVGVVQRKLRAGHRVADLVDLDEVALRDGDEVELQLHVGVIVPPLQVKEFQRVVGVVGKGGAAARPGPPGGGEFILQRAVGLAVDGDGPGAEVDRQRRRVVDAAQVAHQHAVDEHPHVVVAGKLVRHRRAAGLALHGAVGLLHKAGGHGDAEIVVDGRVGGVHPAHLVVLVKGEKLPQNAGRPARVDAGAVVQRKGAGALVKLGKVLAAVVVKVVVGVDLQKVAHVGKRQLAGVGQGGVEQVGKALAALGQLRVAVLQRALHHAGARCAAAGVVVDTRPPPRRRRKLQRVPGVDALVHVGRVDVVGRGAGGDPVIEQVDGGANGRDRVLHHAGPRLRRGGRGGCGRRGGWFGRFGRRLLRRGGRPGGVRLFRRGGLFRGGLRQCACGGQRQRGGRQGRRSQGGGQGQRRQQRRAPFADCVHTVWSSSLRQGGRSSIIRAAPRGVWRVLSAGRETKKPAASLDAVGCVFSLGPVDQTSVGRALNAARMASRCSGSW